MTLTLPNMAGARCAGSTIDFAEVRTHDEVEQARALCQGCPALAACHVVAETAPAAFTGVAAGRFWHRGKVVDPPKPAKPKPAPRPPRIVVDDDHLRRYHAAFIRGLRDPITVEGERAYQAYRKRAARSRARALAGAQ